MEEAVASREKARALAVNATPRERDHIEASWLLASGKSDQALALGAQHLQAHPCDALLLEQLSSFVFFHGGAGKRERTLAMFERAAPAFPAGDWFMLGRRAFHEQELHRYGPARALAEQALSANPQNANAAHAFAHVLHMNGEFEHGLQFVSRWVESCAEPGRLHAHLWWHHALAELELGTPSSAESTFHQRVENGAPGPMHLALADAAGFLWREQLYGRTPSHERWRAAVQLARSLAKKPGKPFIDIHCALALAAGGEVAEAQRHVEVLDELARSGNSAAAFSRAAASAMVAFVGGEFARAAELLDSIRANEFEAMGGSNVERLLLAETLVEAQLISGNPKSAAQRAQELPLVARPRLALWRARAAAADGRRAEARSIADEALRSWPKLDSRAPERAQLDRLLSP